MAEHDVVKSGMENEKPMPGEPEGMISKEANKPSGFRSSAYKAVPQEMRSVLERVVVAGKRILYSPQMKELIDKQLQSKDPIEKKLADGAAALISLLNAQAKPSIPTQVVLPAAVEMLYEIKDFLVEAGLIEELTPDQLRTATLATMAVTASRFGAKPEQVQSMLLGKQTQQAVSKPGIAETPPEAA